VLWLRHVSRNLRAAKERESQVFYNYLMEICLENNNCAWNSHRWFSQLGIAHIRPSGTNAVQTISWRFAIHPGASSAVFDSRWKIKRHTSRQNVAMIYQQGGDRGVLRRLGLLWTGVFIRRRTLCECHLAKGTVTNGALRKDRQMKISR